MSLQQARESDTAGSGTKTIDVINPATEEILDTVPRQTAEDANRLVDKAKAAFDKWKRTPANARAHMMHEAAAKMRSHQEEIVRLLTLEQGKPVPENEEEF